MLIVSTISYMPRYIIFDSVFIPVSLTRRVPNQILKNLFMFAFFGLECF